MIAVKQSPDWLAEEIKSRAHRSSEEWLATLNARKRAELSFHDADRADDADAGAGKGADAANRKYYATARLSKQYIDQWIAAHAKGKVFLDYACGEGAMAVQAAREDAALSIGLDISAVSVERARRNAAQAGVTQNTLFVQGDCENTGLPDACIDVAICSGMLHHLDLSYAFPELRRILRPGGVILAVESLRYNPLFTLYRLLTPSMRTDWEKRHILSLRDVGFARRFFRVENVRYWHFLSLLATPLRRTRAFGAALAVGDALDRVLLRVMPISLLAWMFSFEMVKDPAA
jgi:SAM-dependent methyltransferase